MRKELVILFFILFLFIINMTNSFAIDIDTNSLSNNTTYNNLTNNTTTNTTINTATTPDTSYLPSITGQVSSTSLPEAELGIANILNIILIVVGVLLILLGIAILIRLK